MFWFNLLFKEYNDYKFIDANSLHWYVDDNNITEDQYKMILNGQKNNA